jgi:hypothetical protein
MAWGGGPLTAPQWVFLALLGTLCITIEIMAILTTKWLNDSTIVLEEWWLWHKYMAVVFQYAY